MGSHQDLRDIARIIAKTERAAALFRDVGRTDIADTCTRTLGALGMVERSLPKPLTLDEMDVLIVRSILEDERRANGQSAEPPMRSTPLRGRRSSASEAAASRAAFRRQTRGRNL